MHAFDAMDFDGYAVMWGDKHRTRTLEECGRKCVEFVPQPPTNFLQRFRLLPAEQVLRAGRRRRAR